MTKSSPRLVTVSAVCATWVPVALASQPQIDIEWVRASQGRNVVQVPNDASGSRFSLDALTGSGPVDTPRVQVSWRSGDKQEWRLLAAPLSLSGSSVSVVPIDFQGRRFLAGPISARYQFGSFLAQNFQILVRTHNRWNFNVEILFHQFNSFAQFFILLLGYLDHRFGDDFNLSRFRQAY